MPSRSSTCRAASRIASRASADLLVGAGGIHSNVRTLIDPGALGPDYNGLLGFAAEAEYTAQGEPGGMYFVRGRRAFLGYWVQRNGRTAWLSNLPQVGAGLSDRLREQGRPRRRS